MGDRAKEDCARVIVRDAARRYVASRRSRVEPFVDRHFSFRGSVALHRQAVGWDLVRAPINLFLAAPALAVKLASLTAQRAGARRFGNWLARRRLLLETDVARQLEWLVATELLEIPCRCGPRVSHYDGIAAAIIDNLKAVECPDGLAKGDPRSPLRLSAAFETYLGTRTAAAEIATGLAAAGVGAFAIKQATPGLLTLSSALAATFAQQAAIAAFPLGATLGATWYGFFPAPAGPELLGVTMAVVFIAGTLLAAFSGIVTDPLQRRLGLHRRRLLRLLDAMEAGLAGEGKEYCTTRDHYVARLVDLFDLVTLALRGSHA